MSDEPEKTRPRFDTFSKSVLGHVLEPLGRFEPQKEIVAHPQLADLLFIPSPKPPRNAHPMLRLLHRMSSRPGLFEPFSRTPTAASLVDVLNKSLNLHRARRGRTGYRQAEVWVLSPGKPRKALAEFEARPDTVFEVKGFYRLPKALRMNVIVIRELPRTPETLLFRLMGRGTTYKRAVDELAERMPDDLAMHIASLIKRWIEVQEHSDQVSDMLTQELIDHTRRALEQRDAFIRQQGKAELLERVVAQRLGRVLTEPEQEALRHHITEAGSSDALIAVVLDLTPQQLTEWLAAPG